MCAKIISKTSPEFRNNYDSINWGHKKTVKLYDSGKFKAGTVLSETPSEFVGKSSGKDHKKVLKFNAKRDRGSIPFTKYMADRKHEERVSLAMEGFGDDIKRLEQELSVAKTPEMKLIIEKQLTLVKDAVVIYRLP